MVEMRHGGTGEWIREGKLKGYLIIGVPSMRDGEGASLINAGV